MGFLWCQCFIYLGRENDAVVIATFDCDLVPASSTAKVYGQNGVEKWSEVSSGNLWGIFLLLDGLFYGIFNKFLNSVLSHRRFTSEKSWTQQLNTKHSNFYQYSTKQKSDNMHEITLFLSRDVDMVISLKQQGINKTSSFFLVLFTVFNGYLLRQS